MSQRESIIVQLTAEALSETTTRTSHQSKLVNPFEDVQGDQTLDPLSEKFDINAWLQSVMHITSRDPENFPVRFAEFCLDLPHSFCFVFVEKNRWCLFPES
jgi:hypothetical protein